MKVLGIVGSPRKGGNTDLLVQQVLEGAKSQGAEIEKLLIGELNISPCDGCLTCHKTGRCHIDDDMTTVLEKLQAADGLVLGSPLYGGYLTGQMKVFMDRCLPLEEVDIEEMTSRIEQMGRLRRLMFGMMGIAGKVLPRKLALGMMELMGGHAGYRLKGKKDSVIVVLGAHPSFMPLMKEHLQRAAAALNIFSMITGGNVVAKITGGDLWKKGAVVTRPKLLQAAFDAGVRLARGG